MTTNVEITPQGQVLSNRICSSNRSDGSSCKAPPSGNSTFCYWHDPGRRDEMLAACRRGGSRRSLLLPMEQPLSAEEARGILASVLAALLQGSIDPTSAKSAGYLVQIDRKIVEGQELERRIEILESILKQRDKI